MREIKFRGKRLDNGEWVYGLLTSYSPVAEILPNGYSYEDPEYIQDYTLGEFSGCYDENDHRIFEGDIIEVDIMFTRPETSVMASITAEVQWVNDGFYAMEVGHAHPILRSLYGHSGKGCRIIGNIHDNPELLEGGEK